MDKLRAESRPANTLVRVFEKAAGASECIILAPPFASITRPALGPHILQATAAMQGVSVRVLYVNMMFAANIGVQPYESICDKTGATLIGERVFARLAHGLPALGLQPSETMDLLALKLSKLPVSAETLKSIESRTDEFCEQVANSLSSNGCKIVGCTSNFEQTNASLALLRLVKRKNPALIAIIGGANCEGEMANGMKNISSDFIDYIFSGESEDSFPSVVRELLSGVRPSDTIIHGAPCEFLEQIPPPDFTDYFDQLSEILPEVEQGQCWLSYESSRGCWWGQKSHCTFCGLNGFGMKFREKSAEKVREEMSFLLEKSPTKQIAMSDNIMPHGYHRGLIPLLKEKNLGAIIFYEQKANLTLDQVKNLKDVGVELIQPGIESLSTPLLKLMKKGVKASQNIGLLRYARICHVGIAWNLLTQFPNDSADDTKNTLEIVPKLRHLSPPSSLTSLTIDRFSPYYDYAPEFGISGLRPWDSYYEVFPPDADIPSLAYHFHGEFQSGSSDDPCSLRELEQEVVSWRRAWESLEQRPLLLVAPLGDAQFLLLDTREAGPPCVRFLNQGEALATLVPGPTSRENFKWAIENGYSLNIDGHSVPLALASFELLKEFDAYASTQGRRLFSS